MNTRWIKENLLVVVFLAVFVVLLGVIIVLERRATARRGESSRVP